MKRVLIYAVAAAWLLATIPPAQAASSADTTVTFTLEIGALSITAPVSKDAGNFVGLSNPVFSLGTVSVDDARGAPGASWAATAVSTDFTDGLFTIPAGNVLYMTPGNLTTTGAGCSYTNGAPTFTVIGSSTNVLSASGCSGSNTASWDPVIQITLPLNTTSGTYSGTITHAVS